MTKEKYSFKLNFIISFAYYALNIILVFIIFKYAFKLLLPFILALMVSIIIEPFIIAFIKKFKFKRSYSSIIFVSIFYIVIFAFLTLLCAFSMDGINKLFKDLPQYYSNIKESINKIIEIITSKASGKLLSSMADVLNNLDTSDLPRILLGNFGSKLITPISEFIKTIPTMLLSVLITIISTFFISSAMPDIKKFIFEKLDESKKDKIINIKRTTFKILKKYVSSYTILMTITFSELLVMFYIYRIKPAITLSLIITLVDILPVLGVGTIIIPWATISLLSGDINKALILLSIYLIVTVVRQILEPRIIGKSIGLNPLITLISMYIGFKLFGLIGVILSPIAAILIFEIKKAVSIDKTKL